jgi:hypothetical protein
MRTGIGCGEEIAGVLLPMQFEDEPKALVLEEWIDAEDEVSNQAELTLG